MIRKFSLLFFTLVLLTSPVGAERTSDPRHNSGRKGKPSAKEIEQEREWIALDKTSSAALQAYVDRKPPGSRQKQAAVLLPVAKKLEAFIAGKEKPVLAIALDVYGERNPGMAKKNARAISYNGTLKVDGDVGACWTYGSVDFESPSSFTKGNYAHISYASWPGSSQFAPGSILAIDSGGDRCPHNKMSVPYNRMPVIVSAKHNVVYFGVVQDVGLVHLAGEGEVVWPDGKVQRFR